MSVCGKLCDFTVSVEEPNVPSCIAEGVFDQQGIGSKQPQRASNVIHF
jgi:hypothetical protein